MPGVNLEILTFICSCKLWDDSQDKICSNWLLLAILCLCCST